MFSQVRGPRGNYIAKGGHALKAGYHMIPSSLSVPERLKRPKRYHDDGTIRSFCPRPRNRCSLTCQLLHSHGLVYSRAYPHTTLTPQKWLRGYVPYRTDKVVIIEESALSCFHAALVNATGLRLEDLGSPPPCIATVPSVFLVFPPA